MRRPALYRPATADASAWARPYPTGTFSPYFYNSGDPAPAGDPNPADPPKPGPPTVRTFTQDEVNALAAKEKAQGERAGQRAALEKFAADNGFTNIEDAQAFIEAGRQAREAALSEEEKRKAALDKREQELVAKEAAAVSRERAASRRAILAGLGATGDDLDDAVALLRVADDADDTAITEAAEKLKERRPVLFGAAPAPAGGTAPPPAPGGAPAGGPPPRQTPSSKPGDRGRAMAAARGHKTNA